MVSQRDVGAQPARIGTRYQVDALLGRGGNANVYKVTDEVNHRHLALKQLILPESDVEREQRVHLFEREFLILAQLSHPGVGRVYDYGSDGTAPFYTMELLDGGDLRERSPLPWREACILLAGVCSSLALIHSRRLVHRDVSPGNIRCTQDGQAKLIDFGAMAPMGEAGTIVGTPAFAAPEVLSGVALDGRADLFSFGAALYFALTGQPPYPARNFSQLASLWKSPVPTPSSITPGIPDALDALVMSLLCLERAMRPRNAFEVLQHLSSIAAVEFVEPISVSRAYLSTPGVVGRGEVLRSLRMQAAAAAAGRGRTVLISGPSGVGRSRALDSALIEARVLGMTVLWARAGAARGEPFGVAQALAEQVLERLPQPALASARASGTFATLFSPAVDAPSGMSGRAGLVKLADSSVPPQQRQTALVDWLLHLGGERPLAIAVDDATEADEPSATLLAVLASHARAHRLLVLVTAETGALWKAPDALAVLASHSSQIELPPLTRAETEELLGSLFGDVQNLQPIADSIHRLSLGRPRACLDLARHLVDQGVVTYESGAWTLPNRLDPRDLPTSAEEATRASIARLQPLARWLAEAQVLANDAFDRDDYRRLRPDLDATSIDRAVSELVSNQILVAEDRLYSLAHRGLSATLTAGLGQGERQACHRALAAVYERTAPIAFVRHLLAGGEVSRGLDRLADVLATGGDSSELIAKSHMPAADIAATIERALDESIALERPLRQTHDLRRWLTSLSLAAGDRFYWRAAPDWLGQLKRDSGMLDWLAEADGDPKERLRRALGAASQRYAATPQAARAYRPDEAVKMLCLYVLFSIAIGSRSNHHELLESLPGLLRPFAPLSPTVATILEDAIATGEARCSQHLDEALHRFKDVYARLAPMTAADVSGIDMLRNAVAYALGVLEARMGMASAASWAELLEKDPLQEVSGLYLRKVVALQMGDSVEAERHQKRAEVLALQGRVRQMFTTTVHVELSAHALAGDLTGVKQVRARLFQLAESYPAWQSHAELAEALFQELRGDLEAACKAFERSLTLASAEGSDKPQKIDAWASATAGYVGALVGLDRNEEARALGERALEVCRTMGLGVGISHGIRRGLALAQTKLGQYAAAVECLEALILEQQKRGTTGLLLGASYEARTRIAIWTGDALAVDQYSKLTAAEYRHGRGSALGARWERLMAEARRASQRTQRRPTDVESTTSKAAWESSTTPIERADEFLRTASGAQERAARGLQLLCGDRGANIGYLYLVADRGVALVALHGTAAPPEGLLQHVTEYLDFEVSQSGDDTVTLAVDQLASLPGRSPFHDREGVEYATILLTSVDDGVCRYAGAAVFVNGGSPENPAMGAPLVSAVSAHLIRAGDTRGMV
jgi:tetratricopeptide (TPR) repeat protein/tRNA A-37 threonylcarbamoyl transferase component Bud32